MLSPSANDSISRMEDRLASIHESGEAQTMQIPHSISEFLPGVEVTLLQLIATWSAFSKEKKLVTSIAKGMDAEKSLSELAAQAYGRTALLAANSLCRISGEAIPSAAAAVPAWDHPPLAIRENGAAAALIIGSAGVAPRGFAPFLKLSVDGMRAEQRSQFTKHISGALASIFSKAKSVPIRGEETDLPGILYELFANAEEWGCTNVDKVPIRLPLRGILFRIHRQETLRISADDVPLAAFLQRERTSTAWRYLLEVSVFDSGIGLAQRNLRRRISHDAPIGEELQAVRDCFAKHGSSSDNTSRGLGLYYVMLLANNLQGFLRVRTGRLHLYRDFVAEPYLMSRSADRSVLPRTVLSGFQYLRDWSTGTNENEKIKAHAYAKGAAYNFFLPMKDAQMALI